MAKRFNIQKARADGVPEDQIQAFVKSHNLQVTDPQRPPEENGARKFLLDMLPTAGSIVGSIGGSFVAPGIGTYGGGFIGSGIGETAREALSGEKINPLKIAGEGALGAIGVGTGKGLETGAKLVGKGLFKEAPERIMGTVFKESIKDSKGALKTGSELGKLALENGERGSYDSIRNKAIDAIDKLEGGLQKKISGTQGNVSLAKVYTEIKPMLKELKESGNTAGYNAVEKRFAELYNQNGLEIPYETANRIKRSLYTEVGNNYGVVSGEETEGLKAIARSLKKQIAEGVDGADEINKKLSYYGRIRDSTTDALVRGGRNNMFGLSKAAPTAIGVMGAPATGGASMVLPVATTIGGSAYGKTATAQALKKTGEVLARGSGALTPATQLAGQTIAHGGDTLMPSPDSTGGQPPYESNNAEYNQPTQSLEHGMDSSTNEPIVSIRNSATGEVRNLPRSQAEALMNGTGAAGNQITPEMVVNGYMTSKKEGDRLKAAYQAQSLGTSKEKVLSAQAQKDVTKAKTGLAALNRFQEDLAKDPQALLKKFNPLDQTGRAIGGDMASVIDLLGYFRTGATITPQQRKDYYYIFPSVLDSAEVRQRKLDALKAEFAGYAGMQTDVAPNQMPDINVDETYNTYAGTE